MVSASLTDDDYNNPDYNNNNPRAAPTDLLVDLDLNEMTDRLLLNSQNSQKSPSTILKDGLTKVHQNILAQTQARQRFVTGKDPLLITITENHTKKWLQPNTATVKLLVNGTTIENSLASFDRYQWLDDKDRADLVDTHSMASLELVGEINIKKPGYVNILPTNAAGSSAAMQRAASASKGWDKWKKSPLYEKLVFEELGQLEAGRSSDRLWITGFTLTGQRGQLHSMDVQTGYMASVNKRTSKAILWPNESNHVPKSLLTSHDTAGTHYDDALLISDGFLVPGKDKGGLYIVQNPGNTESEWNVCLTGGPRTKNPEDHGWFYHRSVWLDLTGDGRKSILTARAKLNPGVKGSNPKTQLVWLEMPKPHSIDEATGTPLEEDGTIFDPFSLRHLPWKTRVLVEGPDVMFSVADMDTTDDTVEIFASRFFDRKVTMHSIQRGPEPRVVFERTIDDNCGTAFSSILANLDSSQSDTNRIVVDSGSTVETLKTGDSFSHLLVTSHECSYKEDSEGGVINGGSLFAYRVPEGAGAWKTEPWARTTVASDFTVNGQLTNMINPGAPGFVYTFHAKKGDGKRPLIAIAGDCAESAYVLRPVENNRADDPSAQYKMMCEIECGATVGSIGIGYQNFMHDAYEQEENYAKLYIPCYEKDKILVFSMGSGEEEYSFDGDW
jgi:hypothetical protein